MYCGKKFADVIFVNIAHEIDKRQETSQRGKSNEIWYLYEHVIYNCFFFFGNFVQNEGIRRRKRRHKKLRYGKNTKNVTQDRGRKLINTDAKSTNAWDIKYHNFHSVIPKQHQIKHYPVIYYLYRNRSDMYIQNEKM